MLYFLEYSLESINVFPARESIKEIFDIYRKLLQSIIFEISNEMSLSDQLFLEGYNDLLSIDRVRSQADSEYLLQAYELILFLESIKQTNKIDLLDSKIALIWKAQIKL